MFIREPDGEGGFTTTVIDGPEAIAEFLNG